MVKGHVMVFVSDVVWCASIRVAFVTRNFTIHFNPIHLITWYETRHATHNTPEPAHQRPTTFASEFLFYILFLFVFSAEKENSKKTQLNAWTVRTETTMAKEFS